MQNSIETLTLILSIVIIIIVILLAALAIVYFTSKNKREKKENTIKTDELESTGKLQKSKTFAVESVMDFMEFDKVEDNMIVQKNGNKYIMVVECQGINYDLMSGLEKNAVEEGFIQFLNTIRHPIQIYVQTRTINLESSLQTYKDKVNQIEEDLQRQEMKYKEMASSGNYTREQLNKAYYELTKQRNLTEYGKDIIYNTEKMSLNKNVLNQKYYIIVPYYPEELGQNDFDKEEIKNLAFSELYTRCQSMLRTLAACEVNGKILNSNELVELLYVAYNRDEQEIYGIDKALKAGYTELYSTAPDVLDKRMIALDKEIEEKALQRAKEAVDAVRTEKEKIIAKKEEQFNELIIQGARTIIEQNKKFIGNDTAKEAIEIINSENTKEEVKQDAKKEVKTRTRRKIAK